MALEQLRVTRAAEIREQPQDEHRWLVEPLWGAGAVGIIGGAPKTCKTWLALEMAVAVASGRPCLGRFGVPSPGPVLVFTAEDAPYQVKHRIESLARARDADFRSLDVKLIVETSLLLDRAQDLQRLRLTLANHRPKLLVLDPYVRLQRADENDARQVSAILSALRELSRTFHTAVALVHHARKNAARLPGQALRGSSDFWAWGDSNLYIARNRDGLLLTAEHRAAPSPPPLGLHLLAPQDGQDEEKIPVCLELRDESSPPHSTPLAQRILVYLRDAGPAPHRTIRAALRVRTSSLSDALQELEASSRLTRTPHGWNLTSNQSASP
ncbi:MAG: AAA family ATPase [Chloroflexi bacterium]|nr:AAA family ATPase [Chloroflexota bacterium]